jgi:hypothetical protein
MNVFDSQNKSEVSRQSFEEEIERRCNLNFFLK